MIGTSRPEAVQSVLSAYCKRETLIISTRNYPKACTIIVNYAKVVNRMYHTLLGRPWSWMLMPWLTVTLTFDLMT